MLPLSLLAYSLRDGTLLPHYLTPRDATWVRLLIDELDALTGRTHGDAARILADKTLHLASRHAIPIAAVRAVQHLLQRLWRTHPGASTPEVVALAPGPSAVGAARARVSSRKIRRVVFDVGKNRATPRDEVIRRAAKILGISAEQVSDGLFADSGSERRLSAPPVEPSPYAIIDAHNFALVQEFLLRSEQVVVNVGGHAAPVLRVAKQKGLMYSFALGPRGAVITLPGPVSLSHQAVRYGRALGGLLPVIATLPDWSLEAKCWLGAKTAHFEADSLDPIVAPAPQDIDNAVERRLFNDFRRLGSRWAIAHAAEPLQGTGFAFFPDFTFERGMDRVLVEIIGFHTSSYIEAKLEALRNAGISSVLLCVDDTLACSERATIDVPQVFPFEKRIEVGKLLRAIERVAANRDRAPDSDQPSS
jgi:predicted nuclease of restriction endonuclease-like RecB superfamily